MNFPWAHLIKAATVERVQLLRVFAFYKSVFRFNVLG